MPKNEITPYDPKEGTGLEDFGVEDYVMPRLKIDNKEAVFVDGLSGERIEKLDVVMLGLIKQRILWPPEMGDDSTNPLCKSYDAISGYPDDKFPWKASGFSRDNFDGDNPVLPCDSCSLKEWGSHPTRGDSPWCAEQFTFAILQEIEDDVWAPALVTFQRSGVKAVKAYLTNFSRKQLPTWANMTTITLEGRRRGTVDYSVPSFVAGKPVADDRWPEYAAQYRAIRAKLQTPWKAEEPAPEATTTAPEADTVVDGVVVAESTDAAKEYDDGTEPF